MLYINDSVKIYYELQGNGIPLLLIHGASVDADFYQNVANILSQHYKVITYDRRGSSRSSAKESALYDVNTQVDDARDLLEYLGINKVILIGASAGAIIAHSFLIQYPDMVEKVLLYEPAFLTLLKGTDYCKKEWIAKVQNLIACQKRNAAMIEFIQSIGEQDSRGPEKTEEQNIREIQNVFHFLSNEYKSFAEYRPDITKSKELIDKIIIAVGDSSRDALYATAAKKFAEILEKQVLYYPGYHNAPYDLPKEFAICVLGTLMM